MPRADGAITTTDTRARFFARAYGISRPLVLQNVPRYEAINHTNRIRNELALKEPLNIVLYQGGLQQGRGLESLIDAAVLVPDAYFVFIGGGRLEPNLKERSRALGLDERVYFIPTVSLRDLPSYTASADIGVQPIENTCLNHFSTDSNKLFEYMMSGLPVVATDLPEIRKIINRNDFGLLVKSGNIEELANALRTLLGNDELRRTLGDNARKAASEINWDSQANKLVSLYEDVVGKRYRCVF
jgi:glycosyltransferase involved in cell wall biosynthesis